jgi:adenylylsulfate kinase-like enzyme
MSARASAERVVGAVGFHEIHVNEALATGKARDTKGLYRKVYAGEIAGFTGVSAPYESSEVAVYAQQLDGKRSTELPLAYAFETSNARTDAPYANVED